MRTLSIAVVVGLALTFPPGALGQKFPDAGHGCIAVQPLPANPDRTRLPSQEQQLNWWFHLCQNRVRRLLFNTQLKPMSCGIGFGKNGQISFVKILKPSGSTTLDDAILKVIMVADFRAQEPQDGRFKLIQLPMVQTRGLRLEIAQAPYPNNISIALGPEISSTPP